MVPGNSIPQGEQNDKISAVSVYAKTTGSVYYSSKTRIYMGLMETNHIHTAAMAAKNFKFYTTL